MMDQHDHPELEHELSPEELARELEMLEAEHGAWLDGRIAGELEIALGYELPLYAQALELEQTPRTELPRFTHARPLRSHRSLTGRWVYVEAFTPPFDGEALHGWALRADLLAAIAAMSDEVARAERAAGWDATP